MDAMNRMPGPSNAIEPPSGRLSPTLVAELERLANAPGVDACDVVCDALPGLLLNDLSPVDRQFLDDHIADCSYCRHQLDEYRTVESALDKCCDCDCPAPPPIPFLRKPTTAWYGEVDSPVGPLFVAASDAGVCEIDFASSHIQTEVMRRIEQRGFHPIPNQTAITTVAGQLNEYFNGERDQFEVPLDFSGVTPFTKAVLVATNKVPFGHLSTYRQIAESIGQPTAMRAVGNALGRNPIPVIVPCHRIVRSDSKMGGYTGGPHIKERLLKLEGVGLL
jgi:methylated-DNA-[protein]-cysteine S-methyltransferase